MKRMRTVTVRVRGWGLAALLLVVLAAAAGGACEFKGDRPANAGVGGEPVAWQPRPVALRIYPSTRFVRSAGDPILEARIEFTDAMGDTIKAAGDLRFELFATDDAGMTLGRRLYAWQVPLRSLEQQRQHFDAITRTYHFRLALDQPAVAQRPTALRVTFTPATDGERLETEAPLRSP